MPASAAEVSVSAETARLQALDVYRTLDGAARTALDRLAALAARSLGGSRAAITFIDEHAVWLAGSSGFEGVAFERAGSFCAAVVERDGPVHVSDASAEPAFWAHALVRHCNLRSYAGVAVRSSDRQVVGTIAIFAEAANAFGSGVVGDLERLAELVERFLEERHSTPPVQRVQGWLGVRTLESERNRGGLLVLSVSRGSPAATAGLRPTDILYAIDGQVLRRPSDVVAALSARPIGESVSLRFRRSGEWRTSTAAIEGRGASGLHPLQA